MSIGGQSDKIKIMKTGTCGWTVHASRFHGVPTHSTITGFTVRRFIFETWALLWKLYLLASPYEQ